MNIDDIETKTMGNYTSAQKRGFIKDRKANPACKKREEKRRDIDDINKFAELMAQICPEFYGKGD